MPDDQTDLFWIRTGDKSVFMGHSSCSNTRLHWVFCTVLLLHLFFFFFFVNVTFAKTD